MTLKDIFARILTETGQFMMVDDIELDIDKFRLLVNSALSTYNQYCPYHRRFNIVVAALDTSFGGLQFRFVDGQDDFGVPDWISDLIPVRLAGVHPWYFRQKEDWVNRELEYKRQFPWDYIKPILYVPISSNYDITAVYKHKVTETTFKDPNSGALRKDLCVTTITDDDDHFFELLGGRFLKALGRNRRAFTLNELPISTDSAELVSEGNDMEKDAIEHLENNEQKFWLAFR